jgi:hypothetical protein
MERPDPVARCVQDLPLENAKPEPEEHINPSRAKPLDVGRRKAIDEPRPLRLNAQPRDGIEHRRNVDEIERVGRAPKHPLIDPRVRDVEEMVPVLGHSSQE